MFLFWYRFVRPNMSSIIRGIGEMIYTTLVKKRINDFMGNIFEEICQQYLFLPEIYPTLPIFIGNVGRWWGNNPRKKCQEEIDLMAVQDMKALFGECKWRNAPVDTDVIDKLMERSEIFSYLSNEYIVFSKCGFTEAARKMACEDGRVRLVSFEEMVGGAG